MDDLCRTPGILAGHKLQQSHHKPPIAIDWSDALPQRRGTVPGFDGIHLEESYVLDISQFNGELRFDLELALSEGHPSYRQPDPGERYYYRPAVLAFAGHSTVQWVERTAVVYTGDDGVAVDQGTIDSFRYSGGTYELRGEWGQIRVRGGNCRLVLGRTASATS